MPSSSDDKQSKKKPTKKTLGYKIKRTLKNPIRTVKKKVKKMNNRRLQKNNSRRAKKLLRKSHNSRPTLSVENIQEWYVPKESPIDFTDDSLRYTHPSRSIVLHTLKLRHNNNNMLKKRMSPIRKDDPWGETILHEMKRLEI